MSSDFSFPFPTSVISNAASPVLGGSTVSQLTQAASTVSNISNISNIGGFGGDLGVNNLLSGTISAGGFPNITSLQSGFQNLVNVDDGTAAVLAQSPPDDLYQAQNPYESSNDSSQNSSGTDSISTDDQRLHIIRSRSAKTLYDNKGPNGTYTSDRGPITRIKLLAGPDADPATAVKDARSNVDAEVQDLLAGRFASFFLVGLTTNLSEKTQVLTTFGDNEVVYYFGKQPITMNLTGILFDSLENDWFSKFLTLYAGVLRGTELAKSFSLVQITFPNMIATGTISSLSTQQSADRDTDIGFTMQFIVKDLIPLPVATVHGNASANTGNLIDFSANRSGVAGFSLSTGTLGGGFMDSVNSTLGDLTGGLTNNVIGSLSGIGGVASTLNSFRTNIFSPVYGIISSITKVVKSTTGSITGIISSFTNPVNAILRDITNIATQATGLALLVEHSINSILAIPARTVTNLRNTLTSLKNTAGTISRVPEDVSQTFKRLYGGGYVPKGAAVLSSGKAHQKSKAAILTSGRRYSHITSNRL